MRASGSQVIVNVAAVAPKAFSLDEETTTLCLTGLRLASCRGLLVTNASAKTRPCRCASCREGRGHVKITPRRISLIETAQARANIPEGANSGAREVPPPSLSRMNKPMSSPHLLQVYSKNKFEHPTKVAPWGLETPSICRAASPWFRPKDTYHWSSSLAAAPSRRPRCRAHKPACRSRTKGGSTLVWL